MKFIKVTIESDEITSYNFKAIVKNKKIIYNDNLYKVIVDYSNNLKIIRENEEYLFELEFISNMETKGRCFLKKQNTSLELDILTDYIIIEHNLIVVKYNIITTDQSVLYRLEII